MSSYDHDAEVLYLKELCALETVHRNLNQNIDSFRSELDAFKANYNNAETAVSRLNNEKKELAQQPEIEMSERAGCLVMLFLLACDFFREFFKPFLIGTVSGAAIGLIIGLATGFFSCGWMSGDIIDKDVFIAFLAIGAAVGTCVGLIKTIIEMYYTISFESEKSRKEDYERELRSRRINKEVTSSELEKQTIILEESKNQFDSTTKKLELCRSESAKCKELLDAYYSINIVPLQYRRNIQAIYYFYSYISTSRFSLEQAIESYMHQEIINRLDTIIQQMNIMIEQQGEVIISQRRQEARLKDLQASNEKMLHRLSNIEQDAAVSAQYSQMASTYAEAGMYFSAATYLQALK